MKAQNGASQLKLRSVHLCTDKAQKLEFTHILKPFVEKEMMPLRMWSEIWKLCEEISGDKLTKFLGVL